MVVRKSVWRALVSPEILFLIGALQANLPYLLWRLGYPISRSYRFEITYRPLYLWILAYLAFCMGTAHVSFCLCRKGYRSSRVTVFRIDQGMYRLFIFSAILLVFLQVFLACRLYGVLPILAYSSGYDVGAMNVAQQESGFGQLGLLSLTCFTLNGLILIGLVSGIRATRWNRRMLWVALLTVAFASLFSGKTQGFFVLGCVLFTGCALTGSNPINMLIKRLGCRELSRWKVVILLPFLVFLLVLLHGFTRYVRSPAREEFRVGYAFDSVVGYLSWPLMNMEKQTAVAGLSGGGSDWRGLLPGLLPYKLRSGFVTERDLPPCPRLERTSPSGFLSRPQWCLGLCGMLLFLFAVGVICKCFYVQSRRSLVCLLAYSQIAWTLVAAHSYNHFLSLVFIPAPIMVFLLLDKVLRSRPRASTPVVHGPSSLAT